jgi:hypothetical protein
MYSVNFLSFAEVKSPKRKIDLAASKNPIPAHCPIAINVKISQRSKIPIYFLVLIYK